MNVPVDKKNPKQSRDEIWKKIRALKTFCMGDLKRLKLYSSSVERYVQALMLANYLSRWWVAAVGKQPGWYRYELVKDAAESPRVKADGTEATSWDGRKALWKSMRILRSFTVTDLVMCASVPGHHVAEGEARTYVSYLARAGYLKRLEAGSFRLVRYTGPKAPMIQRVKQVWDPNLKKVLWRPKAEGEGDGA